MSKLETGCKAIVIGGDHPDNIGKVVELKRIEKPILDPYGDFIIPMPDNIFSFVCKNKNEHWSVEGDLTCLIINNNKLIKTAHYFYEERHLMPLKGDFKVEEQTTKNSLPCLSH